MRKQVEYEKRILRRIRSLPEEALPKVLRLLSLIQEGYVTDGPSVGLRDEKMDHQKTRALLASSQTNWAQGIIEDRADRV